MTINFDIKIESNAGYHNIEVFGSPRYEDHGSGGSHEDVQFHFDIEKLNFIYNKTQTREIFFNKLSENHRRQIIVEVYDIAELETKLFFV
jgi:hypothetical protein